MAHFDNLFSHVVVIMLSPVENYLEQAQPNCLYINEITVYKKNYIMSIIFL